MPRSRLFPWSGRARGAQPEPGLSRGCGARRPPPRRYGTGAAIGRLPACAAVTASAIGRRRLPCAARRGQCPRARNGRRRRPSGAAGSWLILFLFFLQVAEKCLSWSHRCLDFCLGLPLSAPRPPLCLIRRCLQSVPWRRLLQPCPFFFFFFCSPYTRSLLSHFIFFSFPRLCSKYLKEKKEKKKSDILLPVLMLVNHNF